MGIAYKGKATSLPVSTCYTNKYHSCNTGLGYSFPYRVWENRTISFLTSESRSTSLQSSTAEQKQNILENVHMSTLLPHNTGRELIVPSPGKKHMRNVTGKNHKIST